MSERQRLSVVIITRNEAEVLSDCLASVRWADEIIVLDAGSNDATRDIAAREGGLVFQSTEWPGFGIQRQRAQGYARGDYILMLDADERVTPLLRQEIQKILQQPNPEVVYSCSRKNLFLDRFLRHSGWYPDWVIRLYARERFIYNTLPVHESLERGSANVVALSGNLQHLACRDLVTFQRKQLQYAEAWGREHYHQQHKCCLLNIISHTYSAFLKTWILRAGFLDGKQGWLLAMINAQYTFNKYAILWALNNTIKEKTHD
ncbi:glycosyltransferase family 2 protein [Candidatus Steffania adelgidicola]|uniref:glycosyltransferase family 2 protein n=1 Tax=Candidatus Steffania adelgidicola TaxID=1076626 RepID=UPI001D029CF4|nr:glycosyltransferase family 2 protein [Candidatus Steffania adelgidicola]